jgi:hypothetical protein
MKGLDGEKNATNSLRPAGLVDRVERLERQMTEHGGAQGETESDIKRDLRFLADILGVTLPSDEPRPAPVYSGESERHPEDMRGRGGWRS